MEFSNAFDGFSGSSLVLDSKRGEIVRAVVKPRQKGQKLEKGLMALRNHSEAERRRRQRINGHLTSLRSMISGTNKMDKASLLAEVVKDLKELKRTAAEAAKYILMPMDIDEVKVEDCSDGASYSIIASLCCEYKHEVLSDLKKALESLHLITAREEIATFGSRMMNRFVVIGCNEENIKDIEGCQLLATSVRQALSSILKDSEEFSTEVTLLNSPST